MCVRHPCLEHEVSIGRREHGRSGDRRTQRLASGLHPAVARWPRRTGVHRLPERIRQLDDSQWDCATATEGWQLSAGSESARRSVHWRAVGNRTPTFSWKKADRSPEARSLRGQPKLARGSLRGSYVSATDQVALEARWGPAPNRRTGPKRRRVDNPARCRSKTCPPGGGALLLQWSHAGTTISVRYRRPPKRSPHRPWPAGRSLSDAGDGCLISAPKGGRSPPDASRDEPEEPPRERGAEPSEEGPGFHPAAEAAARLEGGWLANEPGASARALRTGPVPARRRGAEGFPETGTPGEHSQLGMPVRCLPKLELTASGASPSPEHPRCPVSTKC